MLSREDGSKRRFIVATDYDLETRMKYAFDSLSEPHFLAVMDSGYVAGRIDSPTMAHRMSRDIIGHEELRRE